MMESQVIGSCLKTLLQTETCVVLPGLGGFVGHNVPASLNTETHVFFPPARKFIFDTRLLRNDGLLAHSLCIRLNINFIQANQKIKAFTDDLVKQLNETHRAEISGIGFLFKASTGQIRFEFSDLMPQSANFYGLKTLHLRPEATLAETPVRQPEPVKISHIENQAAELPSNSENTKKETPVIPITAATDINPESRIKIAESNKENKVLKKHTHRRRWVAIAASILIPISFYAWYIPAKTDVLKTGRITVADLNPFSSTGPNPSTYKVRITSTLSVKESIESFKIPQANEQGFVLIAMDDEISIEVQVINIKRPELVTTTSGYFAVTGVFSNPENARNFLKKQQESGLDAIVIDVQGGTTRVGLGGFSTKEDLQSAMNLITQKGYQSWALQK
jgi:hypothetical protein